MEYLGGNRECNTNLSHWHAYWKMYKELRSNYSSVRMTNVEGFRQMLYDNVLTNHTRALECASGVIAGYAFLGDYFYSLDREISYRSFQMAIIFVYTLREKHQIIPVTSEIEWQVSRSSIVRYIQQLKLVQQYTTPKVIRSVDSLRIALVSICAYPKDHPLILKDITPLNRKRYAA